MKTVIKMVIHVSNAEHWFGVQEGEQSQKM